MNWPEAIWRSIAIIVIGVVMAQVVLSTRFDTDEVLRIFWGAAGVIGVEGGMAAVKHYRKPH